MKCAWKELLAILPAQVKTELGKYNPETVTELRLHRGQAVEVVTVNGSHFLNSRVDKMEEILNLASRYSPWAQQTLANGYITVAGGHRIGVCGECVVNQGVVTGFRSISSVCIRIAKEIPGIAIGIPLGESLLILGPPGCGKTTLLRDLIRCISGRENGHVAVVDERRELFPDGSGFDAGARTDVLSLSPKTHGILQLLKTMGPNYIAVDEITSPEDCDALVECARCGVHLLATAHARDGRDLSQRRIYLPILESGLFENCIVLHADKTWRKERVGAWN